MLGYRDMWAMVAVKGEGAVKEAHSKSPEFRKWGATTWLKTEMPLVPVEGEWDLNRQGQ